MMCLNHAPQTTRLRRDKSSLRRGSAGPSASPPGTRHRPAARPQCYRHRVRGRLAARRPARPRPRHSARRRRRRSLRSRSRQSSGRRPTLASARGRRPPRRPSTTRPLRAPSGPSRWRTETGGPPGSSRGRCGTTGATSAISIRAARRARRRVSFARLSLLSPEPAACCASSPLRLTRFRRPPPPRPTPPPPPLRRPSSRAPPSAASPAPSTAPSRPTRSSAASPPPSPASPRSQTGAQLPRTRSPTALSISALAPLIPRPPPPPPRPRPRPRSSLGSPAVIAADRAFADVLDSFALSAGAEHRQQDAQEFLSFLLDRMHEVRGAPLVAPRAGGSAPALDPEPAT